jgi:hypothetical protein
MIFSGFSTKTQAPRGWGLAAAHIKGTTVCILRSSTLEGFKMTDCETVQQPKKCDDVQDGFQQLNIIIRYIFIMPFFIMGFPIH